MIGTIEKMRQLIRSWDRGRIFFIGDFYDFDSQWGVRFGLGRLVEEGLIVKLGRGLYCYPRIVGDDFKKAVLPDAETIAYAIAARERIRIIPYGDVAAFKLGLTGLKVSYLMYLTDGTPRTIRLYDGKTIHFNHTSEMKIFEFCNDDMQLICSAIRALGKDMIGETEKRKIKERLSGIPDKDFNRDICLPPAWVIDILIEMKGR